MFNDLWKFDGSRWTWVSGDNNTDQSGIYGTKGIADAANKPGGHELSVAWIDSSDNLWFFGGGWLNPINDLWKFDGTYWTWISGDNTYNQKGIYGIKGVADDANKPGARNCLVSWKDSDDNLWLFGGIGVDVSGNQGPLNDLWKFDGTRWTWVSGDNSIDRMEYTALKERQPMLINRERRWAQYPGSTPPAISGYFGGVNDNGSNFQFYNDLWKFDGARWTWVSGDNTPDQGGIYGSRGIAAVGNKPGSRDHSISWIDSKGNFWLFGGAGYGEVMFLMIYGNIRRNEKFVF